MKMEKVNTPAIEKPYAIRKARKEDAEQLSQIRWQIDGETQHLDREQGEAFLDKADFEKMIKSDDERETNLFLVAVAEEKIVGFSRCEGNTLSRFSHKAEFGVGILKAFWGRGIAKELLKETIAWSEAKGIRKLTLTVMGTNTKAIALYERFGFKTEGILENDKQLAEGHFCDTLIMGRFK